MTDLKNLEQDVGNLALDEQNVIKPEITFKDYNIKSTLIEGEKSFTLPTPECLEKLINSNIVKDLINYDKKKHESFIESSIVENEEKLIMDFDKFSGTINKTVLPLIILYLGGINESNFIGDILESSELKNPEENGFIENVRDYSEYINRNVFYLTTNLEFTDIDLLFKCLNEIGIIINTDNQNVIYRNIKDSVMAIDKNKICVIIAASNTFWIKSERATINGTNYDLKLNNYNKLFFNNKFIKDFLNKITKHPRCYFGIISSMARKNLKPAIDGVITQFKPYFPEKYFSIDQDYHERIESTEHKKKPTFYRDMDQIINLLKTKEKIDYFNINNIIILESEPDKIHENTKNNSILVNVFSEQYLEYDQRQKSKIDMEGQKVIEYVWNLLDNCGADVREYISKNQLKSDSKNDGNTENK